MNAYPPKQKQAPPARPANLAAENARLTAELDMKNKYTVSTDSVTTTIEASDENEAARLFARSEKIAGIGDESDLVRYFEGRDGWCRINPA